jgi:hypothetical protein
MNAKNNEVGMRIWHRQTHGLSRTPTYIAWSSMKARCFNPNVAAFKHYGAGGITVCKRWLIFENFYSDMGERPLGGTLDRYPDNNGNYEPGNCRWATQAQQNLNTRRNKILTVNGEKLALAQWAERLGCSETAIRQRLRLGWTVQEAVTRQPRQVRQ